MSEELSREDTKNLPAVDQNFNAQEASRDFKSVNISHTVWVPKDENPTATPIVDWSNWPTRKIIFAKSLEIYSRAKEMEGYPIVQNLNINLFEQYYEQLAEDESNKAELIAALWTESVAL